MLSVEQAVEQILDLARPLPIEPVPLAEALGRVLAQDLSSPCDLPPFDNAAMDGYALPLAEHPSKAGGEFDVVTEQAAGDPGRSLAAACAIMTGAVLPDGLDSVVPVEQTAPLACDSEGRPSRIRIDAEVRPGQHVRRAGEDVARGTLALAAGSLIGPAQLMLLGSLGLPELPLRRRPRIAVLCTGRELVDDPGQPLKSGQIRNSNGLFLCARVVAAGAELVAYRTVSDEPAAFRAALDDALGAGAEVIVSTGAVSMGRYDFVPDTLRELSARIVFHRVRMRPGKPLLFAQLAGGGLYFGLPGNPVSCAVGLRFFVEPALRAMLGLPSEQVPNLPLAHEVRKKPGFTLFQKALVRVDATGRLGVELLPGQESFKILPLARANAWAKLPADGELLAAGTGVATYPLGHLDPGPAPG